jgi:hypothetical protein
MAALSDSNPVGPSHPDFFESKNTQTIDKLKIRTSTYNNKKYYHLLYNNGGNCNPSRIRFSEEILRNMLPHITNIIYMCKHCPKNLIIPQLQENAFGELRRGDINFWDEKVCSLFSDIKVRPEKTENDYNICIQQVKENKKGNSISLNISQMERFLEILKQI